LADDGLRPALRPPLRPLRLWAACARPGPGALPLPRPVRPLRGGLHVLAVEVDGAQVAGRVAFGLVVEVRRAGHVVQPAGGDGEGPDAFAELDDGDETVPARAVPPFCPVPRGGAEGGEGAPAGGGEADGDRGRVVVEHEVDGAGAALKPSDRA